MFQLMQQMKMCIQNNPMKRALCSRKTLRTVYALQSAVVMRIVDPETALYAAQSCPKRSCRRSSKLAGPPCWRGPWFQGALLWRPPDLQRDLREWSHAYQTTVLPHSIRTRDLHSTTTYVVGTSRNRDPFAIRSNGTPNLRIPATDVRR